jgi:hypothetical protein
MNVPPKPGPVVPQPIPEDPRAPLVSEEAPASASEERIYLAGRPSLRGFVHYVQAHARQPTERGALVEQWQAARARLTVLERQEAGAADHPPITNLGPEYEPVLTEFFRNPLVRRSFNTLPTDIALVPLDQLVVYQKHIDLDHVRRLRERYGRDLDEAAVFRICLPSEPPRAPVTWSGTRRGQFVFLSPSNDLRYLGASAVEPEQFASPASRGSLVGMVGLAVGFGSNFLNAFHAAGRLILNNGSHRAFALREAGVTHVPCVIQQIAGLEELALVAPTEVRRRPRLFLEHRRPPMLRDYFDPRLRAIVPSVRRLRQVLVRFKIEESFVPALGAPRPAL